MGSAIAAARPFADDGSAGTEGGQIHVGAAPVAAEEGSCDGTWKPGRARRVDHWKGKLIQIIRVHRF
jgi:hypothetical protein